MILRLIVYLATLALLIPPLWNWVRRPFIVELPAIYDIVTFIVGVLGIIVLVLFVVAGLRWVFYATKTDKITRAILITTWSYCFFVFVGSFLVLAFTMRNFRGP